jgi:hypothetical protein
MKASVTESTDGVEGRQVLWLKVHAPGRSSVTSRAWVEGIFLSYHVIYVFRRRD